MELELLEIKMTQLFTRGQAMNKTDEQYICKASVGNHGLFGSIDSQFVWLKQKQENKNSKTRE